MKVTLFSAAHLWRAVGPLMWLSALTTLVAAADCPRVWEKLELPAIVQPEECLAPSLAFDEIRAVTVALGGGRPEPVDETWELSGESWRLLGIEGPPARMRHRSVYDAARAVVLVFGGTSDFAATKYLNDTWTFDGSAWTQVSSEGPSPRSDFGLAYDRVRERVVLFGGRAVNANNERIDLGDTWEWDGVTWELRSESGPAVRRSPAMAYDEKFQSTTLIGGIHGTSYLPERWTWDGELWTKVSETGDRPLRVRAMVYDDLNSRIVAIDTGATTAGTWSWNDEGWKQISKGGPLRASIGICFDNSAGRVVVYGSDIIDPDIPFVAATFLFDGTRWGTLPIGASIPGRSGFAIQYDPQRSETVLVGGLAMTDNGAFAIFNETWTLDHRGWTLRAETEAMFRTGSAMAFDENEARMILFGGSYMGSVDDETWAWDGGSWNLLSDGNGPKSREAHAMVFDPARGVTLLYGGGTIASNFGDTWGRSVEGWDLMSESGPSKRRSAALAMDRDRNVAVLFGGASSNGTRHDDTWEWDGESWTQRDIGGGPAKQSGALMAYDEIGGHSVLVELNRNGNGTWTWDGQGWERIGDGPGFDGGQMIYDRSSGVLVAVSSGSFYQDTSTEVWHFVPAESAGDCNCDGSADFNDIDFFVAGLLNDTAGYSELGGSESCWAHRGCWGDMNGDGLIDMADIDGFVAILVE